MPEADNSESFKNFSINTEKNINILIRFEVYEIKFLIEIFKILTIIYKR